MKEEIQKELEVLGRQLTATSVTDIDRIKTISARINAIYLILTT